VQRLRQLRRREPVFLRPVETAAVDRIKLAGELRIGRLLEMVIEPDEIKRRADPGDADHDMRPAREQGQPIEEIRLHLKTGTAHVFA
jgi:hypothetical protein